MAAIRLGIVVLMLVVATLSADAARGADRTTGPTSCNSAPIQTSVSPGALAAGANGFGFQLFTTLLGGRTGSNLLISPASVALALDMAFDGARGGTSQAMSRALQLGAVRPARLRRQAAALLNALRSTGSRERLTIADSLWLKSGIALRSSFLVHARQFYGARAASLDFRSPAAPATINSWVSCATNGKIQGIVGHIPPQTILYLINAVYFHGLWATPFKSANTHPHVFTTPGGRVSVPLMNETGTFPYHANGHFRMISLPYGRGRFSLDVLLPHGSLAAFLPRLTAANWLTWVRQLHRQYGTIALPRFRVTDSLAVNGTLAALGMGTAFSDHADFLGMCRQPCRLSSVRQKTFLDVYERGTTAAAVTSVGVEPTAIQPQRFQMVVDRPFFLVIRDAATGTILFTGAVNNPATG